MNPFKPQAGFSPCMVCDEWKRTMAFVYDEKALVLCDICYNDFKFNEEEE